MNRIVVSSKKVSGSSGAEVSVLYRYDERADAKSTRARNFFEARG
jgi:hypothetical protein